MTSFSLGFSLCWMSTYNMSSTIYASCVSHKQKTDIVLNVHKVKPLSVPMKIGVFRVIDINENYEKKREIGQWKNP